MDRIKTVVAALISLLLLHLPLGSHVHAQTGGLQVSPAKSVLNVPPGGKEQLTMTLRNTTAKAGTVSVLFRNFTTNEDETGEPKLVDDPNLPQGIQKWLSGPAVRLGGNETRDYNLTISVPAGTASGTYYGVVLFNSSTGEGIDPSVGSLIFVNVGAITQQVAIEEFNLDGIKVSLSGMADGEFIVRLKNTGNGYTVPKIKIEILDDSKSVVETLDANQGEGGVLPGTIRKYAVKISKQLDPPKTYRARITAITESGESVNAEKLLIQGTSPPAVTKEKKKSNNLGAIAIGTAAVLFIIAGVLLVLKKRKKAVVLDVPRPPSDVIPPSSNNFPST